MGSTHNFICFLSLTFIAFFLLISNYFFLGVDVGVSLLAVFAVKCFKLHRFDT